jgi:hypothetical protein
MAPSVAASEDGWLRKRYRETDFISFFGSGHIATNNCGSRNRTMSWINDFTVIGTIARYISRSRIY